MVTSMLHSLSESCCIANSFISKSDADMMNVGPIKAIMNVFPITINMTIGFKCF